MTVPSRLWIPNVVIWLLAVAPTPAVVGAMGQSAGEGPPRDANRACGPNSLYLLLRLSGVEVGDRDIARYYPRHPEGMSMLEMKRACADFGLAADIRRCTKDDLRALRYPVIAHVFYGPQNEADHYVVITRRLDPDWIEVIDGTTGKVDQFLINKMDNIWQGYLLIPRPGSGYLIILIGSLALISQLAGFVICLRWLRGRSPSSPQA
jgi:hypothetical protein